MFFYIRIYNDKFLFSALEYRNLQCETKYSDFQIQISNFRISNPNFEFSDFKSEFRIFVKSGFYSLKSEIRNPDFSDFRRIRIYFTLLVYTQC
jgi:hypothetical protein